MNPGAESQPVRFSWPTQRQVRVCIVVSCLYVWAYFLTVALVLPVQLSLLPQTVMSLIFFPHGVRVLAAWLYGWRSVLYLLPGAILCNLHFAGGRAFDPDILFGTAASLASAPLAFSIGRRFLNETVIAVGSARLTALIGLGLTASVINLTSLRLAYGLPTTEGSVIFVGDSIGLILSLAILRLALRFLPHRG